MLVKATELRSRDKRGEDKLLSSLQVSLAEAIKQTADAEQIAVCLKKLARATPKQFEEIVIRFQKIGIDLPDTINIFQSICTECLNNKNLDMSQRIKTLKPAMPKTLQFI